jgi:hypothetical protein
MKDLAEGIEVAAVRLRTFIRPAGAKAPWRMPGMPCVMWRDPGCAYENRMPIVQLIDDAPEGRDRHLVWRKWILATAREGFDV